MPDLYLYIYWDFIGSKVSSSLISVGVEKHQILPDGSVWSLLHGTIDDLFLLKYGIFKEI